MRIVEIDFYRDGGSTSFRVERGDGASLVWLDTPFKGEPRALRIISVPVRRGDPNVDKVAAAEHIAERQLVSKSAPVQRGNPAVKRILGDIEEWWTTLGPDVQQRVREVMSHRGPIYNPDAATRQARDLSRVIGVRDYVARNYAG